MEIPTFRETEPFLQRFLASFPQSQWTRLIAATLHVVDGEARRLAQRNDGSLVAFASGVGLELAVLEHGQAASVGAIEDLLPLASRLGPEGRLEDGPHLGPDGAVPARRLVPAPALVVGEPEARDEDGVELRLERADGHVLAVARLVGVVEGTAAVELVLAARTVARRRLERETRVRGEIAGAVHCRALMLAAVGLV